MTNNEQAPTRWQHGSIGMYTRHKCKCPICREGKRIRNARCRQHRRDRQVWAALMMPVAA
jgi:hypothetical protein